MRPNKIDVDKKKSHCLRNCIIVSLVMIVVLCGAGFGGIYFAYNSFAEPILGISLFDAFGVIGGVGKYNEEEIVTNKYSDNDAAAFYANLENATCLDLPDDFKISSAVNAMLAAQAEGAPVPEETPMEGEPPVEEGGIASTLNAFTTNNAYLDEVLKNTSFDSASLEQYENGGKDLSLTDKQFGAIINEVFQNLDLQQIKDIEAKIGVPITSLVSIEQVTISNEAESSLENMLTREEVAFDVPGADTPAVTDPVRKDIEISVVLCLHLGDNVAKVIETAAAGQVPGFVGSLASMMLPAKIFMGLGVFPYDAERQPDLFINEVKGDVMKNLLTAVDGILKQTDPTQGVDTLFGSMTNMITSTIAKIEEMVGKLTFVDSSLELDPISAVMTVMGVNDPNAPIDPVTGEKPAYITGDNFFTMLKHIYNADNKIDGIDGATVEQKKETFLNTVISAVNRVNEADYTDNITKLTQAYGVEKVESADPNIAFDMSTWKPSEFVTRYQEIPAHINIVDKRADGQYLYDIPQAELLSETLISDNAMGYMVNELIAEKVASGEIALPVSVQIDSFELYEPSGLSGELRAKFIGEVATANIIKDVSPDAVLYNLMHTVLPSYIFLEMDLPMSANAGKGALIINFVGRTTSSGDATAEETLAGQALTADAFDTLYRIVKALSPEMGEQIKLENLLVTIQEMVNQMLEMINGTNEQPAALAGEEPTLKIPPIKLVPGGVQMPTIYDIMCTATGNTDLAPDALRGALKDMYTYGDKINEKAQGDEVLDAFIADELEGKLFLINDVDTTTNTKPINKTNLFDSIKDIGTRVQNEGIGNVIRIRGTGAVGAPLGLLDDDPTKDTVDKLRLGVTDKQLAAIVNTSGQLSAVSAGLPYRNLAVTDSSEIFEDLGDYYMSLTVCGDFDPTAMGEAPMGMKFENLLPAHIYLTARIRLTGTPEEKYKTEVFINSTTAESKATIDKILGGIMKPEEGKPNVSFAEIERLLGENMSEAFKQLEATGQELTFTNGYIEAMSIYDVIYDNILFNDPADPLRDTISTQDIMDIFKEMLGEQTLTYYDAPTDVFKRMVEEEFEGKMLLKAGTISTDNADIFGSLESLKGGDAFSKIDIARILNYATPEDMRIKILENELTGIMRQEMAKYDIAGLPALFAIPAGGSPLISFDIVDDGVIAITFGLDTVALDTSLPENASYTQILPFLPNSMKVVATVKITSIMDTTGLRVDATTSMRLNNLTDTNYDKAKIIMKRLAGTFDMNEIETQINGQVSSMFDKIIASGMPLEFKKGLGGEEDYMMSGSIYNVIRKSDEMSPVPKFTDITDAQLHSVLCGLEDNDMTEPGAVLNPKPATPPVGYDTFVPPTLPNTTINLSDYYIAYNLFETGLVDKSDPANEKHIGNTEQMAILSGKGLAKAKAKYGAALTKDRGIILGVHIDNTANYNDSVAGGLAGIIPKEISVTMVFDIPSAVGGNIDTNSIQINTFINKMTYEDMAVLNKILGDGNKMTEKVTESIKTTVLGAKVPIPGITITLGDILCSQYTEYVDVSETAPKGVFGQFSYTAPIMP